VLAGLVLATLVVLAGLSATTGVPGGVALGCVSLLWLLVNGGMEGQVLWVLLPGHGLTEADLAGLAGIGLAVWRLVRRPGTRAPRSPAQPGRRPGE
jgi:hypothetical protein